MEDNEQPPAPITEATAPEVVERRLWELSRDEQRVLIITFVGGFASIIVGACVIGGAIGLARLMKASHGYSLSFLLEATAVIAFNVVWSVLLRPSEPGWYKRIVTTSMLLALASLGFFLLAWIGLAAGIH